MLTGCLPVVIAFHSHVPGHVSWWLPGGPPAERMVPFWSAIDYRSFVVEVPEQEAVAVSVFFFKMCFLKHRGAAAALFSSCLMRCMTI